MRNWFSRKSGERKGEAGGSVSGRVPVRGRTAGLRRESHLPTRWEETAYPPGAPDIFLTMQRDPQVRACLTTKRLSVLSEEAEIHPANRTALAQQVATEVERQLRGIPGGVAGIVAGSLDALAMGYAIGERVLHPDGTLAEIRWHDPRRFRFHTDAFGSVQEVEILDAALRLPSVLFLLYAYQARYQNPYGESDLIAAYRPYSQKDRVQTMWLSALDRFGAPTPIARVPTTWQQEEVNEMARLLARLQNESALVLPDDVTLEMALDVGRVEPARAFRTAAEWLDTQIARAILGQELTTQGNSSGAGSYALGQVHESVLTDWIQALRTELAERVLTAQVARPIVQNTFGTAYLPLCPRLTFPNLTDSELLARRTLIATLLSGGVVSPTENWIRRWLGLPES